MWCFQNVRLINLRHLLTMVEQLIRLIVHSWSILRPPRSSKFLDRSLSPAIRPPSWCSTSFLFSSNHVKFYVIKTQHSSWYLDSQTLGSRFWFVLSRPFYPKRGLSHCLSIPAAKTVDSEMLMLSPKIWAYSSNTSRMPSKEEGVPLVNTMMSSAKLRWVSLRDVKSGWYPIHLFVTAELSILERTLLTMTNRYGDKEKPCLISLELEKNPSNSPLTETEKADVSTQRMIQVMNRSGYPMVWRTTSMKLHWVVSKALEISSFTAERDEMPCDTPDRRWPEMTRSMFSKADPRFSEFFRSP